MLAKKFYLFGLWTASFGDVWKAGLISWVLCVINLTFFARLVAFLAHPSQTNTSHCIDHNNPCLCSLSGRGVIVEGYYVT